MDDELKPCPFCGSDDAKITHDHGTYEPGCAHCGTYIGQYSSARSAAAAWNRRSSSPVAADTCWPDVDEFAQHIRWLNGSNKMGAGSLAEKLLEWLKSRDAAITEGKPDA